MRSALVATAVAVLCLLVALSQYTPEAPQAAPPAPRTPHSAADPQVAQLAETVHQLRQQQADLADDVDALYEAAPPPAPPAPAPIAATLDAQEAEATAHAHRLDEAVETEGEDGEMTDQVAAHLRASGQVEVDDLTCSSHLCRIELRSAQGTGQAIGLLMSTPGLGGELMAQVDPTDPTRAIIRIARGGAPLPS